MHDLALTDSLISTVAGGSPPVQALTLAYAKLHIRALGTADDALLSVYIDAAASYFESQTGRQLLTATREAWLDAFPFIGASGIDARIELPHPPLQSVVSVQYIDGDGAVQSFTDAASPAANRFTVSAPAGPYARRGFVEPIAGQSWPIARRETSAVRLRYACGYGDTPDDIPPLARGVLCYLVGHFDTFRTAVHEARRGAVLELPYGVQMMMDGFKFSALPSQVLRAHRWPTAGRFEHRGGW
jgi:uncharacterized phiE125 gp8 family phage protein